MRATPLFLLIGVVPAKQKKKSPTAGVELGDAVVRPGSQNIMAGV